MAVKILNAESLGYSVKALKILKGIGEVYSASYNRATLKESLKDKDVLITRLAFMVDRDLIDAAPNLKIVATPTTGLNHIDLEVLAEKKIQLISLRGEVDFLRSITATAEHTWLLILACLRKFAPALNHVCSKTGWDRDLFRGVQLYGKTLGIVGCGRLGTMVAGYAKAFGMNVIGYDIPDKLFPENVKHVSLETLFKCSDIVSLHLSLSPDTVRIVDKRKLSLMKDGAILVNTARGELIDEEALLDCLNKGKLGCVGLDVLSDEYSSNAHWYRRNRLIDYAAKNGNLLITPHIGGACWDAMETTEIFVANKIRELIECKFIS